MARRTPCKAHVRILHGLGAWGKGQTWLEPECRQERAAGTLRGVPPIQRVRVPAVAHCLACSAYAAVMRAARSAAYDPRLAASPVGRRPS
jgi:hypothetical protein